MLQALWSLEVVAKNRHRSAGVLIFHLRQVFGDYYQRGRVFGGDGDAYYDGSYTIENLGLRGAFDAVSYGGTGMTAFGSRPTCEIEFEGTLDRDLDRGVILLRATADKDADNPFGLRMTRRCPIE